MEKKMKKMEKEKYYIGLDMGTNSVGWAVTDTEYNLIRRKRKDLWGIREFDEAATAVERRSHRTSRRRRQREQVRIGLIKSYFADALEAVDPNFLARLDNSKYHLEDKDQAVRTPNSLFADDNYQDKEYFKQYPTIFHLRKELIENPAEHDVRLVFLAVINMFKHRGHFLNAGISEDSKSRSISEAFDEFRNIYTDLTGNSISEISGDVLENILSSRDKSRTAKSEMIMSELGITKKEKDKVEIAKALCGLKFSINKMLNFESDEKLELEFSSASYDEKAPEVMERIGDDNFKVIEILKEVHDIGSLAAILKGEAYLSFARVNDYEKHHRDLNLLKKVIRKHKSAEEYDKLFREFDNGSYSAYVNSGNSSKGKQRRDMKGRKREDFYATVKKLLQGLNDSDAEHILTEIVNETFMPKQLTSSNGVIPNQVHKAELKTILNNAEKYLPFLLDVDESGLSVKERILALFSFQIPYYVGPLSTKSTNSKGWIVRKEEGQVLPWNINEKVDMKKTSEAFISRMVRNCSYINGEKALPKNSLLYEKFMVLNEINNIKINREPISVELKQKIFNEKFKTGKKVTRKQLITFINSCGFNVSEEQLTGIDTSINNSLSNYGKFRAIVGAKIDSDSGKQMIEDIIFWCTVYGESKQFLKERIAETYSDAFTEEEIKRICGFKIKDWGRLSKEILEMSGINKQTGEILSIIDAMWETNMNFMELINSDMFDFKENLEEKSVTAMKTLEEFKSEDLNEMYFSAPVKKMIWQTLLVIKEIKKVMGTDPEKIFIEMTRSDGEKGKRTDSRKKQLIEKYKNIKDASREWVKEIEKADEEGTLRSKKMYLYFTQMGKDMYTGKPIDLYDLMNGNKYDIDHIYPRHFVKDDNINNNLVLVNKQSNAHKSDSYPLETSIASNESVRALWRTLKEKQLITEEKYRRLTCRNPLTDDEKANFIARQLVETSQGTKGVADIIKQVLPETTIVYSKARNVSDFRDGNNGSRLKGKGKGEVIKFPKSRLINEFHHAHDAYLNIVVGNVYFTKFTQNPRNFITAYNKDSETNKYSLNRMFDWDVERNGYVAWKAGEDGTISTVCKMLSKNTPLMTRATFEGHGGIADQTLYSARKSNEESYIPLKQNDEKMTDVKKYGGFSAVSTAYFFLVEHDLKKKRVRTIETVPIYLKEMIERQPELLEEYCVKDLCLVNPSVRIRKIKIQSLINLNGFYVRISGKTENRLSLRSDVNLVLNKKYISYIKSIEKYISDGIITSEITTDLNCELFEDLLEKNNEGLFSKRPNSIGGTMLKGKAKFEQLSIDEQLKMLTEVLKISSVGTNKADLKIIGGSANSGTMKISKNITSNKICKLITQSVTGIFTKEIDLLTI